MMLRFLLYGLLNCCLSMAAFGQGVLELNRVEPKAGEHIHFTYSGPLCKTLVPEFRVYFFREGPLKWTTLRGKHDKGKLKGDFRLPAGTMAFCIKPDRYKDVREAFVFSVFNDHQPVVGAQAGAAQFHYNLRRYTDLKDSLKAIELFQEEFRRHPESKPKFLLDYFRNGSYGVGTIGKEMQSTWIDSVLTGRDEQFLFQLYNIVKEDKIVDGYTKNRLREEMLRLYPKGELALKEDPNQARSADLSGLQVLEVQYPGPVALGKLDLYYVFAVRQLFNKGKYEEAGHYFKKIRSAERAEVLCRFASAQLLENGVHLDWAADYCESGIRWIDSLSMPDHYATEQEWHRAQLSKKSMFLNRLAEIRYKQGKLKDAIAAAALGEQIHGFDNRSKERYLKFLMEDGQFKEVVRSASEYILAHRTSDQIEEYLRNAYLGQGFSAAAYKVYREGLDRKKDVFYKLPGLVITDVKAIDFSLSDLRGRTVSLKDYHGKNFVLYFFSPSADVEPEIEPYLVKKVDAIRSTGKIELLGIDENVVLTSNKVRSNELRDSIGNAFFKKAGISFPLLLDTYVYKPELYWSDRYLDVSSDYGVRRSKVFFLIDKNGMVRYKSSDGAFVSLEQFRTEFSAALKLIE
jgi:hypothetical protein